MTTANTNPIDAKAADAKIDVVVAGHICLDIIPTFDARISDSENLLAPGILINIGPALMATGGAVSNTGLALHRLGITTHLLGKVGDDLFGRAILDVIRARDPALANGMIVDQATSSAYTLVISPPNTDRSFLHSPGANDAFGADDIDFNTIPLSSIFHFGYPPLMRRMYAGGGKELVTIFRRAKDRKLTTSLDMAHVDRDSPAGNVDWHALLEQVLPYVDLFLPNLDEIFLMLSPTDYAETVAAAGNDGPLSQIDGARLNQIATRLIQMGAGIVGIKIGDQGMYVRTSNDPERFQRFAAIIPIPTWIDREILAPAYQVDVAGTTGAGDCAVAGFLAALIRNASPELAVQSAVAAGACNVEHADAISGILGWAELHARINAGWTQLPVSLALPRWKWSDPDRLWIGPHDASRNLHGNGTIT